MDQANLSESVGVAGLTESSSQHQQLQLHTKELVDELIQLCPSGEVSHDFLSHVLMDQFKGCVQEAAEFLIECQSLPDREASFLRTRHEITERIREEQLALERSRKTIIARWS